MFKWEDKMREDLNNATVNNDSTTTNNASKKEDKTMTMKEKFEAMKAASKAKALEASNKSGYGIGYGATTVKLEGQRIASKIKDAVCGTAAAEAFADGMFAGRCDATSSFIDRCVARDRKAREKADAKAAKEAAEELFEDIF